MRETIPARFRRRVASGNSRPLFLVKRAGRYEPISVAQAAQDVTALATWLLREQVAPGDRVVILSESRPEWGLADIAIQSTGAWSVPLYPSLNAHEVTRICQDAEPVIAVASTVEQAHKLTQAKAQVASLRKILVMEEPPVTGASVQSWSAALAQGRDAETAVQERLERRLADLKPDDTATLIYTSGTTGEPKGVMLSHANFLSNVDACMQAIPIGEHDVYLSFLPLSHVFERMAGWYLMLTGGATIVYAESMETIPENMLEVHPTVMLGVPRFFEKLYSRIQERLAQAPASTRRLLGWAFGVGRAYAACRVERRAAGPALVVQHWLADRLVFSKLRARLGGRLRFFVSGSAPLSQKIAEYFFSMGVVILEGYGLTETSPVIAVNSLPVPHFGSVGPLLAGVEVRIAADGEIFTRGPHIMQGYYRKPQETAAVLKDGWFATGDIGRLDAEGHLYITDRKKDLIKTAGGMFVAPQKLENLFVVDPYIAQAFVCGDRQPYCVVLIVPDFATLRRYAQQQGIPAPSTAALVGDPRIVEFLWSRVEAAQRDVARFEQVKKMAVLSEEFSQASGELTPTMKTKRAIVVQRYADRLRTLYGSPNAS